MLQKKTLGNSGDSAGNGAQQGPSLLMLAQQRQATSGTASPMGTRTPGGLSRLAGLSASPSPSSTGPTLSSTAAPSLSALASPPSSATGAGVRRSLTHLAKPQASSTSTTTSSPSSSPSLASLSSSAAPRRSLAGLGARSTTQPSPAATLGSAPLPTLGQLNGPLGLQGRSGAGLLSSRLQSKDSPTLADLSRQRLQQHQQSDETKPDVQPLESSHNTRKPEIPRQTVVPSTPEPASTLKDTDSFSVPATASSTPTPTPTISSAPSLSSSTLFSDEAAPAVSLIAPPSQFALSIFEKLDPVPSSSTHVTLPSLSLSPYEYDLADDRSHPVHAKPSLEGIKVFQFNEPSPDDIVFKAQGQRALQSGSLAKS
ncbi:hypothetical protein BGZ59_007223 [Podila verticillata]|nr:hypothetical protein BGZ59_007223 [Podila verticillata]